MFPVVNTRGRLCLLSPHSKIWVHFQEKLHFQIHWKQVLSVVIVGIARCAKKSLEQVRCRLEKFWVQISATDIFVFKFPCFNIPVAKSSPSNT